MADLVGQQLGNYRLIRLLGEGGFAGVYLGEHLYLKTQAAIKVLHTRLARDDLEQFLREARTVARLKHPHIVRVLEFGVEGSMPFLVMDYAPNGTLRQRHPKRSRLAPETILPYIKQVAEASRPGAVSRAASSPRTAAAAPLYKGSSLDRPGEEGHRSGRRKMLWGMTALVLVAVLGFAGWYLTAFHQRVTTGLYITTIQVGSGYVNGHVTGESDTFHPGNMVYVVCKVESGTHLAPSIKNTLRNGSIPIDSGAGLLDVFEGGNYSIYHASARVTETGVYTWEISYDGNKEAMITFQVT